MFNLKAKNPPVALEIGEGYASAVRTQRKGNSFELLEYNQVKLPGSKRKTDSLWSDFKLDERISPAIDELINGLGNPRRISLVLPDTAAKTFYLEVENPGGSAKELKEIILFKLQKVAPLSGEGTAMAYKHLRRRSGGASGGHYLTLITSRALISSYERYFGGKGMNLGRIEIASLAAIDLFMPLIQAENDDGGNFSLIGVENSYFTIAIFNDFDLFFSRTRIGNVQGIPKDLAHELKTLNLFSQDQLESSGVDTCYLYGPGDRLEESEQLLVNSGYNVRSISLSEIVDIPLELKRNPTAIGQFIAATAVAARR